MDVARLVMIVVRLLVVLGVIGSLMSCGDEEDPTMTDSDERTGSTPAATTPATPTSVPTTATPPTTDADAVWAYPGTELTAEFVVDGDELTVDYALHVVGDEAVAVVAAIPDILAMPGNPRPDDEAIWVTARKNGDVTVGQFGFTQPRDGGDLAEPLPIYAVRLGPGESRGGTFTTRWPPVARQPYPREAPDLAVPSPDPTITMQLCIGVAPAAVLDGARQAEGGGGRPSPLTVVSMNDLVSSACTPPRRVS